MRRALVRFAASVAAVLVVLPARSAVAAPFSYLPPGDLIASSGKGRVDFEVYAPSMRFPMEETPAFANSQVYSAGGAYGPGGGQCAGSNYDYPWRDNYCENREWSMPLCPSGQGHQGQDIRPATCVKSVHWVVAAVDGTITSIGSYSVYLTAPDGTRYDYLHMDSVQVKVGQDVVKGQRLGKVSNAFGDTPTTLHLHFNIRQNVQGVGMVYVPPYMSLVNAYEELVNEPPKGALEAADCASIRGWAQDPDDPDAPLDVEVHVDGLPGEPLGEAIVRAGDHREDLCGATGSCAHGFEISAPISLLDDQPHEVRAYAKDSAGESIEAIDGSPKSFTCPLVIPEGVRRLVKGEAWAFSSFWDQATVDDAAWKAIQEGDALPESPRLVQGDNGAPEVWLLDGDTRRHVPSVEVAAAWRFALGAVEVMPAAEVMAFEEGKPVRARPFLVKGSGSEVYLIDDPHGSGPGSESAGIGSAGNEPVAQAGLNGVDDVDDGSAGCACGMRPRSAVAWWGLLAGAMGAASWMRRRRGQGRGRFC